jgi:phenylpropionate dioxygenase-like ring-hydroxylating dioxygenase large terminal subunit
MLSKEENELITRIGPGTAMGSMLRQYWIPAMLSSELPWPDSEPVRVLLLGEKLIGFRASDGQAGLIGNHCPHRGASLFFGRNEEAGLRCVYHGWKFGTDGACVDMPNEPIESDFKQEVRATAYPCQERGGIVWTYMGKSSTPPPLPAIEANLSDGCTVRAVQRECNWLQALEGDIDTSHVGFLHFGSSPDSSAAEGTFRYYLLHDRAPRFKVVDTACGAMYGAYREALPGQYYWRLAQFMFPFYTIFPNGPLGRATLTQAWVPMDDEHLLMFRIWPRSEEAPPVGFASVESHDPPRDEGKLKTNNSDWYGRFRLEINASTDFHLDRGLQRRNHEYTGIRGTHHQDQAITESMGSIYDRSSEHLGTSDAMIIRVRRRLLAAVRGWAEKEAPPPAVGQPEAYMVRAGEVMLPKDVDWLEGTQDLRTTWPQGSIPVTTEI